MRRKPEVEITEPFLDLHDGRTFVLTARGALRGEHPDRNRIGKQIWPPTSLRLNCSEYPRKYAKRAEKMGGGTGTAGYSSHVLRIPYTHSGRALAQVVLDDWDLVVRGITLNPSGKWDEGAFLPLPCGVRVGQPEYPRGEQLGKGPYGLPDMPLDLNTLPVTLDAVEELYRRVIAVCLREGIIAVEPETDDDWDLLQANTLDTFADELKGHALRLERDIAELQRKVEEIWADAEQKRDEATALRRRVEANEPLPEEG